MNRTARKSALLLAGFTLLEMVVTMVILGIVSAMVGVFLQRPIEGYFATTRRAQLVDAADFALRRIARDLATAVPNSARSDGTLKFIELLQARTGGRYCNAADCGFPLPLDTNCTPNCKFSIIGPAVSVAAGDSIVIGNLPNSGCNAYSNLVSIPNRRSLDFISSPATTIQFTETTGFSSSCAAITNRFQILVRPVTYACDGTASTLWRYSDYQIQASQKVTIPDLDALSGSVRAALATNVNCGGTSLDATSVGEGLVELRVQLQDASGESINLYRQVKLDNTP